jgi:hypothetical protein
MWIGCNIIQACRVDEPDLWVKVSRRRILGDPYCASQESQEVTAESQLSGSPWSSACYHSWRHCCCLSFISNKICLVGSCSNNLKSGLSTRCRALLKKAGRKDAAVLVAIDEQHTKKKKSMADVH